MLHPTTENYIFQLKEVINRGYLALVYFDVGIDHNDISQYGYPDRQGSNLEHSAVVFGYMTTQSGEDFFYVCHWENHFIFHANNLLQSTEQLQRRQGEVFYDIATTGDANWIELQRIRKHEPEIVKLIEQKQYRNKLFSPPPPKELPTFRNCIIAVGVNSSQQIHEEDQQKIKISRVSH